MRVLVLGSGAKDHAITWLFSQSKLIDGLFVAHGNLGTESIAVNLKYVNPTSPESVYRACLVHNIDTVFIGTEEPLLKGVVDFLESKNINVIGAPSKAVKLEDDRAFTKSFLSKYNVPTTTFLRFKDANSLESYLTKNEGTHFIIKSNKQAPSRIILDDTKKEPLLKFGKKLLEQGPIVLEKFVEGLPLTITLMMDKKGYISFPICSEYTKTEEGGSPTGGMGSICPVPISEEAKTKIYTKIVDPVVNALQKENLSYKGVLTLSIVYHIQNGPTLVDLHVRFNDPAIQSIVPLIKSDIVEILNSMNNDTINQYKLETSNNTCTAIVIASEGYPEEPKTGVELKNISSPILLNTFPKDLPLFFFGSIERKGSKILTTGGRCVTIVGKANNIVNASKAAYSFIHNIDFPGSWYREDIGTKFYNLCEYDLLGN